MHMLEVHLVRVGLPERVDEVGRVGVRVPDPAVEGLRLIRREFGERPWRAAAEAADGRGGHGRQVPQDEDAEKRGDRDDRAPGDPPHQVFDSRREAQSLAPPGLQNGRRMRTPESGLFAFVVLNEADGAGAHPGRTQTCDRSLGAENSPMSAPGRPG